MKESNLNNIQTKIDGSCLVIRFDRAPKKNALTVDMYKELNSLLDEASNDKSIRVVVFSSTSSDFSAGNDLQDFKDFPPLDQSAPVFQFIKKLTSFKKPMVAAVDGLAVGVGFTMLLHCDFVYVTDRTKLIAPFVNLGLVPEAGSTKLLTELVGHRKASEVFMLGDAVFGPQAVELGIATSLVSTEEVEKKSLDTALRLSQKAPDALRITRDLMRPNKELINVLEVEAAHFSAQVQSKECAEAIAALQEKRAPNFSK